MVFVQEQKTHQAVVIGAGLSGLASAILLKKRNKFEKVIVLEKQEEHSRDNFILLNYLGTSRLRQLGVYHVWKEMIHGETEFIDQVYLRGNVQQKIQTMKARGILPPENPDNCAQLKCYQKTEEIIQKCKEASLAIDQEGTIKDFDSISHETVVALHDRGMGIEFVHIHQLERAMVQVAKQLGVEIIYNCWDIMVSKNASGVYAVKSVFNDVEVLSPDLVVICEGYRRSICKEQLNLEEVVAPQAEWFIYMEVDKYFGPHLFAQVADRDPEFPHTKLHHFACGGIQEKKSSYLYFQVPSELALHADEQAIQEFCWRHLKSFTKLHQLEIPDRIVWSSKPFKTLETIIAHPIYGDNTIVIGDAARAGTFQNGVGFNLALVRDLSLVEQLGNKKVKNEVIEMSFMKELEESLLSTSEYFHKLNKQRYC
jgi:2-polyprenyl-6-methoxyphenol hydroxylase-like FAD-dependent oxidoreductase